MQDNNWRQPSRQPGPAPSVSRFYGKLLNHPWKTLLCLLLIVVMSGFFARYFQIDASSDTLVNESDDSLRFSREINSRYHIQDFLVIAYTPRQDLLSDETLDEIAALKKKLQALDPVESVTTLLDVPLLESPPVPVKELAGSLPTLESPGVDRDLAREELRDSPIYSELLVSQDLTTTAFQINIEIDKHYRQIVAERDRLAEKSGQNGLTSAEAAKLDSLEREILVERQAFKQRNRQLISDIREIMQEHEDQADLFLGGLTMIANDLIRFIKNDLKVFGLGVFCLLVVMLGLIFRRFRWIAIPLTCCGLAALVMIGLLGLFGWKVTVISSNFISLQLIITMAISIHLVVRYRELLANNPDRDHRELVIQTMQLKLVPCLYAGLTTMAGFGSLLLSGLKPVITFGWMMVAGIVVSLLLTFLVFPVLLALLPKTEPPSTGGGGRWTTQTLARLTESHGGLIVVLSAVVLIVSVVGITRLTVENAFVNYFKESTEIYQGLSVIDRKLGGTTPFDVLIDFSGSSEPAASSSQESGQDDEFDRFAELEEEDESEEQYWFTPHKMEKILAVHDYLDGLPATGKVLSLGTMLKTARRLNNGRPLDSFELPLIYNELPEKYRQLLVEPYVSVEHNQVRLSVRVVDTTESLRRDQLIKQIYHDLTTRLGYDRDNVRLTGMLILYNNVLQQLFDSQIKTLGVVLAVLMVMFLVLFRSVKVAVIAVFPNLLSIAVVLGMIGWLGIPLDMMTITIAAISVGIAVDDTIHYIHRFKKEFMADRSYLRAMRRSHDSIGYAMYYTSVTIIMGFSILALSNFIPTIVFGLLTGLAMLIALLASLTLLPQLMVMIKPFGAEDAAGSG
ncbi:MAG: efflux RND transporter permease subunit [Desulfosudaceae bacterium]